MFNNKREIFGFRKYKAYGLASAVIAASFLVGGITHADEVAQPTTSDVITEVSADTTSSNAVASQPEVTQPSSTESNVTPAQPEVSAQPASETDANTKHFEIDTTDVSRPTFEKRLDALDTVIKTNIATALNKSMEQAATSYNQIGGVTPVTNVPTLTKDDINLAYNRTLLKPTKQDNVYMFTEKPIAIAYDVNVPEFLTTYQKMNPMVTSAKTSVSPPIVVNKFLGDSASKPIDEIGNPLDNIGTKVDSLTSTRRITYRIEGSGDTAQSSIYNSLTRYTPFFVPSIISYDTKVPGDAPQVDVPELKVTRFALEDGTNIQDVSEGFVDAPTIIGNYQFTGTTNTNEAGDVQTHIYKHIETEVPNEVPSVDVPALDVTRYVNEEGTEIKDAEEDHVPAPSMIGDTYEFTGRTETTEDGTVQTHVYKAVEHEVPNDAPKREPEEIQITLHIDEETGKELVEYDPGLVSPKEMEYYIYTGKTTQDEGIRTHYYKKVITEVPGDAPVVDVPELKVTQYQTEAGVNVKDAEEGFVDAPNTIDNYQFTGTTNTNEAGDVQTHIYKLIETEVPNDAPSLDVPELKVTRHVNEKGDELLPIEEGSNGPRKTISDYEYTGRTDVEDGITTHVYAPIRYEIPGDAPSLELPALQLTRYVNQKGDELLPIEEGTRGPRKTIGDYEYTGRTDVGGGITTHVYAPIRYELPGDAPSLDVPKLEVTLHVNEEGKELIDTEKGTQQPREAIGEYQYTGRTTETDGITTHVYAPIKHEIPGDAPIVNVPELKVTRYVNEKGDDIKAPEAGFINAPQTIGDYEFTGQTKLNDDKDVQTHVYKLVEQPEPSHTPEPKNPDTPQPEVKQPIELAKSNNSVAESVEQPQIVKELPKTGESKNNLALVGASLLTAFGLTGFMKRKREN